MAPRISLCVIAGNESAHIERLLAAFAPAFDELSLVIATGSAQRDDTDAKARAWCVNSGKQCSVATYQNAPENRAMAHIDNFAAARNEAFQWATGDWLFWADCDDLIDDAAALRAQIENAGENVMLRFPYSVPQSGKVTVRERAIRRETFQAGRCWHWPVHENLLMHDGDIEYKKNADSTWLIWTTTLNPNTNEDYITDVLAGTAYDVRARFENVNSVLGAYDTESNYTVGLDTTAPSAPANLAATSTLESITLDWDDNTEDDLSYYEVWRHTSNSSGSATRIANTFASRFIDSLPSGTTTYYYWIKAVDRTGNASSFSSVATASATAQSGVSTFTLQIQSQSNGTGYVSITVNGNTGTHLGSGLYEWTGLAIGQTAALSAPASDGIWTFTSWGGASPDVDFIVNAASNTTDILMVGNLSIVLN